MRRIFKRMGLSLAAVVLAFVFPLQAYAQDIAYGADVGWLSQLEASGYTWQNVDGSTGDVLEILKEHGVDSIRLRVFVRPPSTFRWTKNDGTECILGYCDTTGLLYMAQRAKDAEFFFLMAAAITLNS